MVGVCLFYVLHVYSYNVGYSRLKPGVVVLALLVSRTVVRPAVVQPGPPIRRVPLGDCQATCPPRPSDSTWDVSQAPVVKVSQVVPDPGSKHVSNVRR